VKAGGDLGFSSSWLAGVSWLATQSTDRRSGDEDEPLFFNGDSELWIADFVWKWAPNGNWRQRNLKFQAEYAWRDEDGEYTLPDGRVLPWKDKQQGWYAQVVYQPIQQWRLGVRVDGLDGGGFNPVFSGTPLAFTGDDPMRYSLMVDWSNSEFSRVRLQYNRDEAGQENDDQFGLQYIYSIGAHGAHSF
jgi:hypothetical protein